MARPNRAARTALAVAGWLAAAGVAVAVGLVAVSALGRGILAPGPPMAEPAEVEAELSSPASSAAADREGPEGPGDRPRTRHVEHTPGGTVVAACDRDGQASLLSWSPAQGFHADDIEDGPDDEVELTFESEDRDVDVSVECRNGKPRATVDADN
ncbi:MULTISPECIES: hypothetical protein [Prauserella salsuginis group]|uniref:Septum formation initiator n=1 Tax=Prauserella salsuginis TaxID=387889 RepID=A0ABW6G072_9PSEU|nr:MULTISPECIES: hypothetical protein [Prauserella salsuginis group]MCR3721219.1 hypothetical protein [Prauserella flava]MCR3734700.1 hypothetical protein [Prauserella salsuginis]